MRLWLAWKSREPQCYGRTMARVFAGIGQYERGDKMAMGDRWVVTLSGNIYSKSFVSIREATRDAIQQSKVYARETTITARKFREPGLGTIVAVYNRGIKTV